MGLAPGAVAVLLHMLFVGSKWLSLGHVKGKEARGTFEGNGAKCRRAHLRSPGGIRPARHSIGPLFLPCPASSSSRPGRTEGHSCPETDSPTAGGLP